MPPDEWSPYCLLLYTQNGCPQQLVRLSRNAAAAYFSFSRTVLLVLEHFHDDQKGKRKEQDMLLATSWTGRGRCKGVCRFAAFVICDILTETVQAKEEE